MSLISMRSCFKVIRPSSRAFSVYRAHKSPSCLNKTTVFTKNAFLTPTLCCNKTFLPLLHCPSKFISTEVDQELNEFLTKEIAIEKQQLKDQTVPKIEGFTVTADGSRVTLSRKHGDETVVVKFDINEAIATDSPLQGEDEEPDEPQSTMCKPPFHVEITNPYKKTLSIHCYFPDSDNYLADDVDPNDKGKEDPEHTMYDMFEIDEISIHDGDATDSTYGHHASVMDGNLYELLMDMLDERGINSDFINQMVQFSTTYEHNKYVTFLEQLQAFVHKK